MFLFNFLGKDKLAREIKALDDKDGSVSISNLDNKSCIHSFTLWKYTDYTINGAAGRPLILKFYLTVDQLETISSLGKWKKHSSYDYRFEQFPKIKIDNSPVGGKGWSFSLNFKKNSPDDLLELFELVEKIENIDGEFITFIKAALNIRISEQRITKDIFALVNACDFNQAIEEAKKKQDDNYYEAIWTLAEHLRNNKLVSSDLLMNLYQSISEANTHYPEAKERLITYFTTTEQFPNQSETFLLEKKLALAIESQNKCLIADIFNQLCGYKSSEPVVPELTGNVDALISLATHIRKLNNNNASQKETIKEQQAIIQSQTKEMNNSEEKSQAYNPSLFYYREGQSGKTSSVKDRPPGITP